MFCKDFDAKVKEVRNEYHRKHRSTVEKYEDKLPFRRRWTRKMKPW